MRYYISRRFFSIVSFLVTLIFILSSYPTGLVISAAELSYYIDADGTLKTVQANDLLSGTQYLTSGWYIVRGKVSTTNLRIEGSVNLILADDCEMTANATADKAGIEMHHMYSLTIYGQSHNTGILTATGNGKGSGIGGSGGADGTDSSEAGPGGHCGNLTINGGNVTADRIGGGDGGQGISSNIDYASGERGGNGGVIVLNRGTINVNGNLGGGNGGNSAHFDGGNGGDIISLTVNGGNLEAGTICGGFGGNGSFGFIPISGGTFLVTGLAGNGGNGGTININGGNILVNGKSLEKLGDIGGGTAGRTSSYSLTPGIGGNGSTITIRGGTTVATGIIGGGTGSPLVSSQRGSSGSIVMTGGSLSAQLVLPTPTNGTENGSKTIYKTELALENLDAIDQVLYVLGGISYTYGIRDLQTDESGKLYLWLPSGAVVNRVYTADIIYSGSVTSGSSGVLEQVSADTDKPAVTSVSPAKGSVNISVNGSITVTFNEVMRSDAGRIELTAEGADPVLLSAGTWSVNNTKYSVGHTNLVKGTTYTIVLSEFLDFAGNILDENRYYTFQTIQPIPMYEHSYINEAGKAETASAYKLSSTAQSLSTGWYVAEGSYSLTNMVINGDVRLILTDGCMVNVTGTANNAAVRISSGNTLTIYGQALGTGTLNADASGLGAGIGGKGGKGDQWNTSYGNGESCGILRVWGGKVSADRIGGGDGDDRVGMAAGRGGQGGTVLIGGGTVSVSVRIGGGDGGDGVSGLVVGGNGGDGSSVTVTGGTVLVSGKVGGGAAGSGVGPGLHLPAQPGGAGTCTITGGSVKVSSMQPAPKNGSVNGNKSLSRTTVTLSGAATGVDVRGIVTTLSSIYGTRDMKTDAGGVLYLWLPSGTAVSEVFAGGKYYSGSVTAGSSGTLNMSAYDTQAPVISSSSPAEGSGEIQPDGSISITFSKVMDITEGVVTVSADGSEPVEIPEGQWSYGGTVYSFQYSNLQYSADNTFEFSGFTDMTGIDMLTNQLVFTTVFHPKTVLVGDQTGNLMSTIPGTSDFIVTTISIDTDSQIILNNIYSTEGIIMDDVKTTGDLTIITIGTTEHTPSGSHPLSLTIDGATSEIFWIEIAAAVHAVSLSQDTELVFPSKVAGYDSFPEEIITITNTGNMPSGSFTVSVGGDAADAFTVSDEGPFEIGLTDEVSFGVKPRDGLLPGEYRALIIAGGEKISTESFEVSLVVTGRSENLVTGTDMPGMVSISGTNIFVIVENDVSVLPVGLAVSGGASWKLYRDMTLTDEITDRSIALAVGANMAFIVVTAENGSTRSYAISVIRMQGEPLVGGSPQTGDRVPAMVVILMICSACLISFCAIIVRKMGNKICRKNT